MKKISLKTIKKSLNLKGKEDGELVIQPGLPSDFPRDSVFGACYNRDVAACDLGVEEEKLPKGRAKGEGLMGTLKRRLSAKQKSKSKGADEDSLSSSSAPVSFGDSPRPPCSPLHGHHYSPTPWPLRPDAPQRDACFKAEGPGEDLQELHMDIAESLKNGDMQLDMMEMTPQEFMQYALPLDEGLFHGDGSSPMEVLPAEGDGAALGDDGHGPGDAELVLSPDLFESSLGRLLMESLPDAPPLSPLLPPLRGSFSEFSGAVAQVAERVRRHLNFDPSSAPGMGRVYDAMRSSGPLVVTSLTVELKKLARQGWYWGPVTRWEAEEKLSCLCDGSFLVRDSSDERYLLSLSFRSQGKTLHTRVEHSNGRFSFYEQPDVEGHTSIVDLIEHSIRDSENGAFCYSRSRLPGSATYPVRLTNPVSRFMQVRSLQYLCRFVIRQYTRIDLIQKLPLPSKMKDYLQEKHY